MSGYPTDGTVIERAEWLLRNEGWDRLADELIADPAPALTRDPDELRKAVEALRVLKTVGTSFPGPNGDYIADLIDRAEVLALLSAEDKAATCPDCGRSDEHAAPCINRMRLAGSAGDKAEAPR